MTYVDRGTPVRGRAWAHHTLGAVVHLALRALSACRRRSAPRAAAAAQVDRHWSARGVPRPRPGRRAPGTGPRLARRLRRPTSTTTRDPVGLERWVSVTTPRMVAEGRVDRIDDRGAELVVVDYKTSRTPPSAADARESRALALYAVATQHTLRRPCRRVELHHVPTGEVDAWRHDDATLGRHIAEAADTAEQAAAAAELLDGGGDPDTLFPPRTSPRCSTCEVRWRCPEGRAAAPELEPWALLEG